MAITGLNHNDAARTLTHIQDEIFSHYNLLFRNLLGKGNSRTKVVSLPYAILLVMVLPGKFAKELSSQFDDLLYLAGDNSFIC